MSVERKEEIKVVKLKEGIFIKTVLTTIETRGLLEHLHPNDAIIKKEEQKTKEIVKFYGFLGGTIAGTIGGLALIVTGVENFNAEQIATGVGAVVMAKYFLGSAKNARFETGLANREINKIKQTL